MRLLRPSRLLGRTTTGLLGRTSKLLGRTGGRLLGKTLAFLGRLALKLGVTRRVLVALIGIAAVAVLVLILLVVGLFNG